MNCPPLLILGASARAAAASAARAGFAPMAVDLFADRDLAAIGPVHRVDRDPYPAALADVAARMPEAPWIYTGGLENDPDLVDRIARDRPLLGIGGEALRAVRDPARWTEALRRAGLPALPCVVSGEGPSEPGAWLLKPRASAGGKRIRPWSPGMGMVPEGWYVQAIARGSTLGATFVGDGGSARLVGVAEQILGHGDGVSRAAYQGSIGPCRVEGRERAAIARVGEALAEAFGLRGLFGVDLILDGETPWPVEINPRYTASVEILEEGLGVALMAEHARAFGADGGLPPIPASPRGDRGPRPGVVIVKRILFAERPAVVPEEWTRCGPVAEPWPTVADIPAPGTLLRPGDPILTVFSRGSWSRSASLRNEGRARRWRRRIDGWPSP